MCCGHEQEEVDDRRRRAGTVLDDLDVDVSRRSRSATAHSVRSLRQPRSPALKLAIYDREEKLGQLEIGRGSLYMTGAHRQIEKRLNWDAVGQKLNDLAYGKK